MIETKYISTRIREGFFAGVENVGQLHYNKISFRIIKTVTDVNVSGGAHEKSFINYEKLKCATVQYEREIILFHFHCKIWQRNLSSFQSGTK